MTSILLILLLLSQIVPSTGSNQTMCISNFSVNDPMRGSFGIWVSLVSLFFLGLSLLHGIYCWGDMASIVLPSYAIPSTPIYVWCDVIVPVGKGKIFFLSLGMHVMSENESQSFWGSGMEIMLLRVPLFMF
jgi:hypothetical protein